jgi:SLOG-like protein
MTQAPGRSWRLPEPGGAMPLAGFRIGISISDSPDLERRGFSKAHLQHTLVELARYLLAAGATLAYGGDLRKAGYTEALVELVVAHHRAGGATYRRIESYLAWPLHLGLGRDQEAEKLDEVHYRRLECPADLGIDPARPPEGDGVESRYARARAFTTMREAMNQDLDARLVLGGPIEGFQGKYPGIAEEAFLAVRDGKPLFLLGAFGGCAGAVIEAVRGGVPEALTAPLQRRRAAYAELMDFWNERAAGRPFGGSEPSPIDYERLAGSFRDQGIDGLRNGLTVEENERLFDTVFLTEMVRLVLQGLASLAAARG